MGIANNFKCKWCKKPWSGQRGKAHFCDNRCQYDFVWNKTTKPKIRKGLVSNPKILKRFLCEEQGEKCNICEQGPEWNGKPLVLQLDHKDGDSDNNWPRNIRLLCPNCHTQTHTYGSKGVGSKGCKMTKRASLRRAKLKGL